MPELVALALPPNRRFVETIEMVWSRGDAIAPLDLRLPEPTRRHSLQTLRPTRIIEVGSRGAIVERNLDGGSPVADGDALVMTTSGTSGNPKAVVHTHDSIEASALATSSALAVDSTVDRWLACLPVAHIGGLSVILRSLITGTAVEVHDGFDSQAVRRAAAEGATLVSLVTRTLSQIDPSVFRRILIGGASAPDGLADNVWSTYGMTETGSGVVYGTSQGQLTLDGCQLRTVDGPAGPELQVRGPMLFRGYRSDNGPDVVDPFTKDGWFPTGDLGELSADGTVTVHGRRGDVIVTGGENVWPEPVERLLRAREDVNDVAVVGQPDPEWGHQVVAVIVPASGSRGPDLDAVRQSVKAELPPWCAPKAVIYQSTLPKTSLGKIRRAVVAATLDPQREGSS